VDEVGLASTATKRVDQVTKNSTSGNCTVGCNGYSELMVWNTNEVITVGYFVTDHSGDFGAVTLHDNGNGSMTFTANEAGTDFASATITDGYGTAVNLIPNDPTVYNLSNAFSHANVPSFHPAYYPTYGVGGVENSLLNFRAYNNWLIDIDGNKYRTMIIGNQEWMMSNLQVTHYADGVNIPNYLWSGEVNTTGGYRIYNENYGALYNWFVQEYENGLIAFWRNGIAETTWHIPTEYEWSVLYNYLGGTDVAGGKLKETGLINWDTPNTDATNEYYFYGLPAGDWTDAGTYIGEGQWGVFWTSNLRMSESCGGSCENCNQTLCICEQDACVPRYPSGYFGSAYAIYYNNASIVFNQYARNYGFSIRCVRTIE
jgi:uncharacterized protein (TIGR02145 family)